MKNIIIKIKKYYFNWEKEYNKLEMFSNWLTILIPFGLFGMMLVYASLSQGMNETEMKKNTGMMVLGFFMLVWFGLVFWEIIYKTRRRVKKRSIKTKKRFIERKEDWDE